MRDICKVTGADIKSWTEPVGNRPCRTYVIEGEPRTVMHALEIVCDAVDHYKRLCEGAFCGEQAPMRLPVSADQARVGCSSWSMGMGMHL